MYSVLNTANHTDVYRALKIRCEKEKDIGVSSCLHIFSKSKTQKCTN